MIGSAGGITSLVSYAALLLAGVPPLAANVTNALALLGSGAGAALRAPRDIGGHRATLTTFIPLMVLGSLSGAGLLVITPSGLFAHLAPFLIAFGALVLLLQPRLAAALQRRGITPQRTGLFVVWALVALYNGYFGAGSGILVIAILLITAEPLLYRANALKNVIICVADIAPAILFALDGKVVWHALWPLVAGATAGGLIGPGITRRVPAGVMRPAIACFSLGYAVYLLIHP